MKIYSALGGVFLACQVAFCAAPAIVKQPVALKVNAGSTALFSVTATNSTGYQWQYNSQNLPNETNATLLIENVSTSQAGTYRVLVYGDGAAKTSVAAKLTVVQGSVVQFNILGTNVVVELFDNDKPVTVKNFITCLRKEPTYTNTFFHRLIPGFIMQGGYFGTTDRGDSPVTSTNLYSTYVDYTYSYDLPSYIINEFGTGPKVRNTYGTLTMAKIPGFEYSTSAQWFFNLGDNSSTLDVQYGGYTVFGRVIQGLEVLDYVNKNTNLFTITNLSEILTTYGSAVSDFPCVKNGGVLPRCSDLFYANINILSTSVPKLEKVKPTVTVSYPRPWSILTNSTFSITGKVSDSSGAGFVSVFIDHLPINTNELYLSSQVLVNGATQWSAPVTNIEAGYYLINVQGWDNNGNYGSYKSLVCVGAKLNVAVNGNGSVLNNLNGRYLEIGTIAPYGVLVNYTMTAVPKTGYIFAGWYGLDEVNYSRVITFHMKPNLALTAKFVTNDIFPAVLGTYNGLFAETNEVKAASAGYFTLTTTSVGKYTGSLYIKGTKVVLSGEFDCTGHATCVNSLPGTTNKLYTDLYLDITNRTGLVSGTVSNSGWQAQLVGYKSAGKLTGTTTPSTGSYTATINGVPQCQTNGTASISIAATGSVSFSGKLGDKSILKQSANISTNGLCPLYASYYSGNGILWGWVNFTNSKCAGELNWVKPATAGNTSFSAVTSLTGVKK